MLASSSPPVLASQSAGITDCGTELGDTDFGSAPLVKTPLLHAVDHGRDDLALENVNALWGGPCQQPAPARQPAGYVSYLGSCSSSPSGVSRSLQPSLASVATSRESLGQNHHQTSCSGAPDTQTLGEVTSDYVCSQQPSEYMEHLACVRHCAGTQEDGEDW
ncbi:hypothetical protein AAY473_000555 [Plecturocebus cupreus]